MNVATFEPAIQPDAAILHEMDLHVRMAAAVPGQKIRQQVLDHLRRGANPQYSGLATLEQARPLADGFDLCQHTTEPPQEVFALRCQLDTAADTVEQLHPQLGFEPLDLPGGRRLGQVQPGGGASEPAMIGNCDKRAQVRQVHFGHIPIFHRMSDHK